MTEQEIQRAVFAHIRSRGAPDIFAFHPANGGYRRPIEAAILKGMGLKSGVPDIIIICRGITYALELKTETGKLSANQADAIMALGAAGAVTGVAYGLDPALAWLEERGLLRGVAS